MYRSTAVIKTQIQNHELFYQPCCKHYVVILDSYMLELFHLICHTFILSFVLVSL